MSNNTLNLKFAMISLSVLILVNTGFAAPKTDTKQILDEKSPLGCRNVGYKYELKILDLLPAEAGEKQSLYFVFNRLGESINLYQMLKDNSTRNLYLNHTISPRQWAVLSTSEKELKYICTVNDPKLSYGKVVDCADSVKVCEYARVKYGMNNKGNYWVVKSNTSGGAVNEVLHYGIIPR